MTVSIGFTFQTEIEWPNMYLYTKHYNMNGIDWIYAHKNFLMYMSSESSDETAHMYKCVLSFDEHA